MNNNIEGKIVINKVSREHFIESIKKWVLIDSQLKIVNEKTRKMRDMKKGLTDEICNYMTNLKNNKISISDGELKIYEKKEYTALTFGYIEKCLAEIIPEKTNVEYIINYLKEKREITVSNDIRRNIEKP